MRIALFTLESALSAAALRRFLEGGAAEVVLIGRARGVRGGLLRAGWRHLRRSGPRLLPYLAVNYALPQMLARARRLLGGADGLAAMAATRGIPLLEVEEVNGPDTAAALRRARPDLIVSFHFDRIFAAETLALAPMGGINLHPSLLPLHRGPAPTLWALAEDPPRFGVTVHRLAERIDAGAVLAQAALALPAGTTASAAARRLHEAGVALLEQAIRALAAGAPEPAPPAPLPYCPFPPPDMLRALARRRRRTVGLADLRAALGARGA
ncbi:formyltransferase family protein [Crenalkalicoccus roseus]|uniref:formyltransferase family protein n=1 Tax=Crenalkalicoccus roseus TaxID=1485588 RepID=UPI001081356A|nr:formyltransferase family protein [Crenalkalicoccus roseus]